MENLEDCIFKNLHDQYKKLKTLEKNEQISTDSESAYNMNETLTLINTMETNLDKIMEKVENEDNSYFRLFGMKCALMYEKAKFLLSAEKEKEAEEVMSKVLEVIKPHFLKTEITFLILKVINHYSCLLSKREEHGKARIILEQAEEMYTKLKSIGENIDFYTNDDLFMPCVSVKPQKKTADRLEMLVTNNLLKLAFIHNKQGDHDKFAFYNHQVLKRQLKIREIEATVWAMKAARLASYFIIKDRFREARNHLSAAFHVLEEYETELKNLEPSETNVNKMEELQVRFADIAKCWVKYGLFLFGVSKTHLVSYFCGQPDEFLENVWKNPFDDKPSEVEPNSRSSTERGTEGFQTHTGSGISKCISGKNNSNELPDSKLENTNHETDFEIKNSGNTIESKPVVDIPDKISFHPENSSEKNSTNEHVLETPNQDQDDIHVIFATTKQKDSLSLEDNKNISDVDDKVECDDKNQYVMNEKEENLLLFELLDLSIYEKQVSAETIHTTEEARELFLYTHSWLKRSKIFYTVTDHPMEYVNAILDLSELYKYLAFFEEDIENQYAVQKRRADALETLSIVLREVHPQCYLAVCVELLRELAEVQLEMLGLNLQRLFTAHDVATPTQNNNRNNADTTLHKMEALADIHSRLEQFGDSLGHGVPVDIDDNFYDSISPSEMFGDSVPYCI